jgi:hypothetical protein
MLHSKYYERTDTMLLWNNSVKCQFTPKYITLHPHNRIYNNNNNNNNNNNGSLPDT